MNKSTSRRRFIRNLTALGALASLPAAAQPVNWPSRPVRFIVPFPPGGTPDLLARLVSARLTAALGQQFIVDNRAGASGSLGAGVAAKSTPDGYTFLFAGETHALNPTLIQNLPFDTVKDLAPVMLIGTAPAAIVTNMSKPYKSFGDVIKAAKAKPDSVTYGTVGSGSGGHLMMTLLQQTVGIKIVHMPYKGAGPMIVDALGGQIDLGVASVAVLGPHVQGGRLRGIAVTSEKRSSAMPDVPTLAEQGFPGITAHAWFGIFTPAGIPKPVLDRFHAELTNVFNAPDVRKQLAETQGMDLAVSSPEELQKFLVSEIARWGKVVKDNNIRAE